MWAHQGIIMKNIKLKNLISLIVLLLAIAIFILSFFTAVKGYGENEIHYRNIIWGCKSSIRINDGYESLCDLKPVYGSIIGTILSFICGIILFVIIFISNTFLSNKLKFIISIICGGLMIVGGILLLFTLEGFYYSYADDDMTVSGLKQWLAHYGIVMTCPLSIISGILSIVGGVLAIISQFIKNKAISFTSKVAK